MKQWIWRLCAMLCAVFWLVGCGAPQTATPVTDGFTCRAAMQYCDMAVEGVLTCSAEEGATLTFDLPKSLQGVTLGWRDGTMTMALGSMQVTVPPEKVPQSALIRCLLEALTASHPKGELTDEGVVIRGEMENASYTLMCHPETGLPLSLSVPDEHLEAVFTDVTRLTETA